MHSLWYWSSPPVFKKRPFLLFAAVCTRLAGLRASKESPTFSSHLLKGACWDCRDLWGAMATPENGQGQAFQARLFWLWASWSLCKHTGYFQRCCSISTELSSTCLPVCSGELNSSRQALWQAPCPLNHGLNPETFDKCAFGSFKLVEPILL